MEGRKMPRSLAGPVGGGIRSGALAVLSMMIALVWFSSSLHAQAYVSATGTFTVSSGQSYDLNFNTNGQPSTPITFRTWSWHGGTNAAGQSIGSAGFDSQLSLFNGANALIANNDDIGGGDDNSLIS